MPIITYKRERLATGWTVLGSKPIGGEFLRTRPDQPWAHPASYIMGAGSFPGIKRSGRGAEHPPSFIAEVKERERLYPYTQSGTSWAFIG